MKCPTCGRRPSERRGPPTGPHRVSAREFCPDPIHDLADRCVELERERDSIIKDSQAAGAAHVRAREETKAKNAALLEALLSEVDADAIMDSPDAARAAILAAKGGE